MWTFLYLVKTSEYQGLSDKLGAGRFAFCGTFLLVAETGRYPASCPEEPGLSSPPALSLWNPCRDFLMPCADP